jgi:hypothetical protein
MTSVPAASVKAACSKLMTQQKIDRRIKSGRGSGVKESYEPWVKVWDIKSKGVSHIVSGVKVHGLAPTKPDTSPPLIDAAAKQPKFSRRPVFQSAVRMLLVVMLEGNRQIT